VADKPRSVSEPLRLAWGPSMTGVWLTCVSSFLVTFSHLGGAACGYQPCSEWGHDRTLPDRRDRAVQRHHRQNQDAMFEELTLNKSAIAYLFKENPTLRREDNLSFYDKVVNSGIDLPSFSFEGGTELVLQRKGGHRGKAGIEVRVGEFQRAKLRLLIGQSVEQAPVETTRENADAIYLAFQSVWQERVSQPELTEVTLEFFGAAPSGDARVFLGDKVARLNRKATRFLGRELTGFGLRLVSGPVVVLGDAAKDPNAPPLPGADINLRVESSVRDPSQVFFQVQAKWPALNVPRDSLPGAVQSQVTEQFIQVNPKARQPTFYLDQVYDFVQNRVVNFLRESGQ
jgi:hypothetical protein